VGSAADYHYSLMGAGWPPASIEPTVAELPFANGRLQLQSEHRVSGEPERVEERGRVVRIAELAPGHFVSEPEPWTFEQMLDRGALGRLGVDFVSVHEEGRWCHYALEINLRKGGTTHTFRILQLLTGGTCDPETGLFATASGEPRFYYATDNLKRESYRRLTPEDLIDVAVEHDLHFDAASQEGVFFHLIGALAGYGKVGVVCVARERAAATRLYERTAAALERAAEEGMPN